MNWIRIVNLRSLERSWWIHSDQGIYRCLWCTMTRSWINDVDSDQPERVHPKDAFLWDDPNQCSKITQIMLHQRGCRSHSGQGFIAGVFDAPWSEWSAIIDVDLDHPKRVHPKDAFLWDDPDQWSKITRIMVHQRSWWIHSGQGFSGPFDVPKSLLSLIIPKKHTRNHSAARGFLCFVCAIAEILCFVVEFFQVTFHIFTFNRRIKANSELKTLTRTAGLHFKEEARNVAQHPRVILV